MKQRQEKVKVYADKTLRAKKINLEVGDTVLVRQSKTNKFSTLYDPQPYTVISIKGSSVTARRGEKSITRHISFIKMFGGTSKQNKKKMESTDEEESSEIADGQESSDDEDSPEIPRYPRRVRRQPEFFGR